MSRYTIPAYDTRQTCVLGWDNPLQTFFAQVFIEPDNATDDPEALLWEGTLPGEITDLFHLQTILDTYATIPGSIAELLEADQRHATPPTPLQQMALRLFQ